MSKSPAKAESNQWQIERSVWKNGVMEHWDIRLRENSFVFRHYSIIPVFHYLGKKVSHGAKFCRNHPILGKMSGVACNQEVG